MSLQFGLYPLIGRSSLPDMSSRLADRYFTEIDVTSISVKYLSANSSFSSCHLTPVEFSSDRKLNSEM